jgi:hypothetical protein
MLHACVLRSAQDLADLEDCHTSSSSCKQTGCTADKQQDSTTNSCSTAPGCCKTNRANCSSSSRYSSFAQLPPFPEWLKQYVTAKQQQQQQQQLALSATAAAAAGAWVPNGGGQVWLSPSSLQQLAGLLRAHGSSAQLVSGNTGAPVPPLAAHTGGVVPAEFAEQLFRHTYGVCGV